MDFNESTILLDVAVASKKELFEVLFIRLKQEIEWETFDDSTVKNVFALMVPKEDEGTVHLEMLSRLATALLEETFIQQIRRSEDKTQLVELIKKEMIGERIK